MLSVKTKMKKSGDAAVKTQRRGGAISGAYYFHMTLRLTHSLGGKSWMLPTPFFNYTIARLRERQRHIAHTQQKFQVPISLHSNFARKYRGKLAVLAAIQDMVKGAGQASRSYGAQISHTTSVSTTARQGKQQRRRECGRVEGKDQENREEVGDKKNSTQTMSSRSSQLEVEGQ
jgi:hypothetical protein